jgi:hypothetical protein
MARPEPRRADGQVVQAFPRNDRLWPDRRTLDPFDSPSDFPDVDSSSVKVVGRLRKTPWQRFARLQRTAAKLARGRGQPKGVFLFASHQACDAWTKNLNRTGK